MSKKVLITGATGYLGHRLVPIASEYADVYAVARSVVDLPDAFASHALDITSEKDVHDLFSSVLPDAVIHAAASNPGSDEKEMDAINHIGAANIAAACATCGCRLVSVSSDVVHNGFDSPFADNAVSSALAGNQYGETKALGEQAIMRCYASAAIVRTSLIYGLEKMDRGTEGFVARLNSNEPLKLFDDVLRQPVWVDALSRALCRLAFEFPQVSGTINVAGDEVISRAEYGIRLLDYWGVDTRGTLPSGAPKLTSISGAGIDGLPMNLSLSLDRAKSLGFDVSGVSAVLSSADTHS